MSQAAQNITREGEPTQVLSDGKLESFLYDFYNTLPEAETGCFSKSKAQILSGIFGNPENYTKFRMHCRSEGYDITENPDHRIYALIKFQQLRQGFCRNISGEIGRILSSNDPVSKMRVTAIPGFEDISFMEAFENSAAENEYVNSAGEFIFIIKREVNGYLAYSEYGDVHHVDTGGNCLPEYKRDTGDRKSHVKHVAYYDSVIREGNRILESTRGKKRDTLVQFDGGEMFMEGYEYYCKEQGDTLSYQRGAIIDYLRAVDEERSEYITKLKTKNRYTGIEGGREKTNRKVPNLRIVR